MSWQLLSGISVIFYSVYALLQRVLMREEKSDPVATVIILQCMVGGIVALFSVCTSTWTLPDDLNGLLVYLFLDIALYALANIFIFRSLKEIEASQFAIIFASRVLFTIAAATLFLSEGLQGMQMLGMLLIIVGIVLGHLRKTSLRLGAGEMYAFAAAACFGFANTLDRKLLGSFSVYPYMIVTFIGPGLFIALTHPRTALRLPWSVSLSYVWRIFVMACLLSLSAIAFYSALQVGTNASQVVTVTLSSVVLTVILSILFLKEREAILTKSCAALITFVGLLLVG